MNDGKKGICAVIGSCASIFWVGAFIFGFPGVMAIRWQEAFQAGRGAIGTTLFFVLGAVGLFMFFVGRWQERFGTRRMIRLGVVLCGLDIFYVAFAGNLYMLYSWAFVMGLASCFIYVPALTAVQRWFQAKRGLVSGIVNLTFGISGAVMAPVFGWMLNSMGYVAMNLILGAVALMVGLVAARYTDVPETGLVAQAPATAGPIPIGSGLTVRESVRTPSFWFLWLTWALQGAAGIAMVTLSTHFGRSLGLSLESAVVILTAFNLTNGLSRLAMGYLSDHVGRTKAMSVTFLAAGVAYLLLPHSGDLAAAAVLAAVIGFAFGTLFAVSAPLVIDCFGMRHFGAIFGLTFTAYGFVAAPLGPSLSGYLLDSYPGDFSLVFGYLGCFCLVSAVLIRFVKPVRREETVRE